MLPNSANSHAIAGGVIASMLIELLVKKGLITNEEVREMLADARRLDIERQ